MKKIKHLLLAGLLAISVMPLLHADEIDLLKVMQFKARPDLAGVKSSQTMAEATTGVIISVGSGDASAKYTMEKRKDGSLKWFIAGEVAKTRKMIYTANLPQQDLTKYRYYTIRTRSLGLRRSFMPHYNVMTCGDTVLLKSGYVFNDSKEHTMVGLLDKALPAGGEIKLQLETDNSALDFEILDFRLSDKLIGDQKAFAKANKKDWRGYKALDISKHFNSPFRQVAVTALKKYNAVIDYPEFPALEIKQHVPFKLSDAVRNYAAPPCDPDQLKKTVEVLGFTLNDDHFPPARLDEIVIPLSGKTAEIYALLGCEMFPQQTRYVAPTIPQQFGDVDCFGIQIDYADGTRDRCFPRHIEAEGFVIQGAAGAYAIPVDKNKELKAIRFQNRFIHNQIGVAALTLNDGAPLVITEELRNPPPKVVNPGKAVTEKPLQITRSAKEVVFENGHYRVKIDIDNKFNISEIVNYHAPDMKIALSNGGFEIKQSNKLLTGNDFTVQQITEVTNGLKFTLKGKAAKFPVTVDLTLTGDASDELYIKTKLHNSADWIYDADFRFPSFRDVVLGSVKDTVYYYPKTRVSHSTDNRSFLTPIHERAYHVQFFDIYNPIAGAGIALHTRDRSGATFDFGLSKTDNGVYFYLNNSANWNRLEKTSSRDMADTVLQFHGGDWKAALGNYKAWIKTWFKPYPTQLPEKWYKMFYSRGESMFSAFKWCIPFYDPVTKTYKHEASKAIDMAYMDCLPDFRSISFWNWPEGADKLTTNGGNFDDGIYDPAGYCGGADNLRNLIKTMKDEGRVTGIYTIATYLPKESHYGKTIGRKVGQVPAGGHGIVADSKVWFPCLDMWKDYYANALARAQKELDVDAVYLDCYPFGRYSSSCYSKEHGHPVPQNINHAQRGMLMKIRETVPNTTAIYTEDPSIDYDAAYISGNWTYYFCTIHEHRAKSYDINDADGRDFYEPLQNIQRYVMPHLKQLGFPCGWVRSGPVTNEVNALFFNGEGVSAPGWFIFDMQYLPKVRNWLKIQHTLWECFVNANAEPLVPTAAGEIYANKFPGNNRTVWTLWNSRFNTYRGAVLEVEHKEGARYYDAWNVQEIKPVIKGNIARLSVSEIEPQGLGCVLQYFGELPKGLPTRTVDEERKVIVELP